MIHFQLMKCPVPKGFSSTSIHHSSEAVSCSEAIDRIAPALIITDYLMSGTNGVEFPEPLCREDKDMPVIRTTGQGLTRLYDSVREATG